jgi:hypothetical protein
MFYNPMINTVCDVQLDGYIPYVLRNPIDTRWYTVYAEPTICVEGGIAYYTHFMSKHLDTIKYEFIQVINDKYVPLSLAGYSVDIPSVNGIDPPITAIFDSDDKSLNNINGAVTIALLNPAMIIEWGLKNNSKITLTGDQIMFIGLSAAAFVSNIYECRRAEKDLILACTTLEEILALNAIRTWI